jgi:hypothetical protein
MTIARTTVRTIIDNPGISAKATLALVQLVHPGRSTEKCVAWYKVHIKHQLAGKPNRLSAELRKLVVQPSIGSSQEAIEDALTG